MKKPKQTLLDHLEKSMHHHAVLSTLHQKLSKAHGELAHHHEAHPVAAAAHRDLKQFHENVAAQHDDRQRHYAAMHERIWGIGESELFDSHSDAADDLRSSAGHTDLLKRFCGIEV